MRITTRGLARILQITVPEVHRNYGCRDGLNCVGPGCQIGIPSFSVRSVMRRFDALSQSQRDYLIGG